MRDPSIALAVLRDRGERGLPINRVYRILYNPELYLRAYGNSIKVPREGKPPLETHWGGISLARKTRVYIQDAPPHSWSKGTELVERLLADTCEICGSHESIQVHHIRALKDLDKPGRRARTEVEKRMAARRRKTMVLCRHCHNLTHQGLL